MYYEVRILKAVTAQALFPLCDVCGRWVSPGGAPEIRIGRDGRRYRLTYTYDRNAAFTVPLSQSGGMTCFDLYGQMQLAYDDERDMLLTDEGLYTRAEDEA